MLYRPYFGSVCHSVPLFLVLGNHEGEWGDALIVVLDPYWHTMAKPDWGWTLGEYQYKWFKNTLSASKAKRKFVFCHNLVGGSGTDARGGAEFAHRYARQHQSSICKDLSFH